MVLGSNGASQSVKREGKEGGDVWKVRKVRGGVDGAGHVVQ